MAREPSIPDMTDVLHRIQRSHQHCLSSRFDVEKGCSVQTVAAPAKPSSDLFDMTLATVAPWHVGRNVPRCHGTTAAPTHTYFTEGFENAIK
jgi:hypothetical protein